MSEGKAMNVIRTIFNHTIQYVVLAAAIALFLLFASHTVQAGEREHGDTQNPFDHYHKNMRGEDVAKGVVVGVFLTCVFKLVVARVADKRWTWCGGENKSSAIEAEDRITPGNLSDPLLVVKP